MKTLAVCKEDFMEARREFLLAAGLIGVEALATMLESRIEHLRLELETAGADTVQGKQGRIAELRYLLSNIKDDPPKPGM